MFCLLAESEVGSARVKRLCTLKGILMDQRKIQFISIAAWSVTAAKAPGRTEAVGIGVIPLAP